MNNNIPALTYDFGLKCDHIKILYQAACTKLVMQIVQIIFFVKNKNQIELHFITMYLQYKYIQLECNYYIIIFKMNIIN